MPKMLSDLVSWSNVPNHSCEWRIGDGLTTRVSEPLRLGGGMAPPGIVLPRLD